VIHQDRNTTPWRSHMPLERIYGIKCDGPI
jgi:hypothetical protein